MSFEYMKPELPSFYDEKKFRFGQQAFYNNIFSMMIAKLCGLVSLLAIKTILDVIMFTQNSSTACIAYRRYASTILHTLVWHEKDPTKSKEWVWSERNEIIVYYRSNSDHTNEIPFRNWQKKSSVLDIILEKFISIVLIERLQYHDTLINLMSIYRIARIA